MKLSTPARELVSLIRRHDLTYDLLRTYSSQARKYLNLRPTRRGRQLPKLLPESSLRAYFSALDRTDNLQHQLLLRLLLYTAIRVSELCRIKISDVDIPTGKIFIDDGKGSKDRYVLFPDSFRLTLRAYIDSSVSRHHREYLFESQQHRPYSTRRIQQIVTEYGRIAGLTERIHPHLFRHQMLTWLTSQGLGDAQIQLISGHTSKKSLEVYQHVALSSVSSDYQQAVKNLGI